VAEGTALLKLHRGNSIEGSNPSLSAIFLEGKRQKRLPLLPRFCGNSVLTAPGLIGGIHENRTFHHKKATG
jgi:hypothetical protein